MYIYACMRCAYIYIKKYNNQVQQQQYGETMYFKYANLAHFNRSRAQQHSAVLLN